MVEVSLHEINISDIVEQMNKTIWPANLAELKCQLAGGYFYLSERLNATLGQKHAAWGILRADSTSDLQAERKWQHTESGIEETKLKLKMKAIEKLMSGISTKISVAESEKRMNR